MPIYPSHIQQFFNAAHGIPGFNKQDLVDRYFLYLERKQRPDTSDTFFAYADAYLDGHVGGFDDGIKYAKP
ncbi:MAG TPA: hypothetical protein VHE12_05695 [bacterium]|nr:hypothetical protein [bacterium]